MTHIDGWRIDLACGCGATGTYTGVVPSIAGGRAATDGWAVDRDVLARPGVHEATCPDCLTLRAVG